MGIGSIGSVPSFWQQDQSYWNQSTNFYTQDQNYLQQQAAEAATQSADDSLYSDMGTAQTDATTGLATIATDEAQARVKKDIAADEAALAAASGSTTSSTPTGPAPATAVGTVPLTSSTALETLRIPPGGSITVTAGKNVTSYASTGTDTVGDLINAINSQNGYNADVTASINAKGELVITGNNEQESVTISGTFAPDVGFGPGNQTFNPIAAPAPAASTTPTSSSTASSSDSSKSTQAVPTLTSENISSAASLLADSGVSGSLVDMLV
jgi:hypothetical protein